MLTQAARDDTIGKVHLTDSCNLIASRWAQRLRHPQVTISLQPGLLAQMKKSAQSKWWEGEEKKTFGRSWSPSFVICPVTTAAYIVQIHLVRAATGHAEGYGRLVYHCMVQNYRVQSHPADIESPAGPIPGKLARTCKGGGTAQSTGPLEGLSATSSILCGIA